MSFTRKDFYDGVTYFKADWDELQNNIGDYYDALISTMQGDISAIEADYLTSAHKIEGDPHPNVDMDYIKQGTTYKKITATEKGYYDLVYAAFGGSPSMDNIPDGTTYKKLTATQESNLDTIWSAFGASPSMDNIPQGSAYKKITTAEKALYDSGYYDILDQTTTVKFGHGANVNSFYFAKGGDDDGADIFGNDIHSRGCPVYILVFSSGWSLINTGASKGSTAHALGYRPDFGIVQVSATDPTGQPEEYIYTNGYAGSQVTGKADSYGTWNDTYYNIYNNSPNNYYFRILLFAYLGS